MTKELRSRMPGNSSAPKKRPALPERSLDSSDAALENAKKIIADFDRDDTEMVSVERDELWKELNEIDHRDIFQGDFEAYERAKFKRDRDKEAVHRKFVELRKRFKPRSDRFIKEYMDVRVPVDESQITFVETYRGITGHKVWMSPEDYLRLVPMREYDAKADLFYFSFEPEHALKIVERTKKEKTFPTGFLDIVDDKVTSQEGRHSAVAARMMRFTKIPVIINSDKHYTSADFKGNTISPYYKGY